VEIVALLFLDGQARPFHDGEEVLPGGAFGPARRALSLGFLPQQVARVISHAQRPAAVFVPAAPHLAEGSEAVRAKEAAGRRGPERDKNLGSTTSICAVINGRQKAVSAGVGSRLPICSPPGAVGNSGRQFMMCRCRRRSVRGPSP